MESDATLVLKSRSGDADAFGALVKRYERLARATALNVCGDKHAAEDVVQEAFVAAFEALGKLQDAERFGSWLLSIARNKAVRYVRSASRRGETNSDVDEVCGAAPDNRLTPEAVDLLALVERLPDHERVVVGLKHFDGRSIREISAITSRPTGTISKQLSRSYEKLRMWAAKEVQS